MAVVAMVAAVGLAGCSSGGDPPKAEPAPCPTPSAAPDTSLVPKDFPLETFGTITSVKKRNGFLNATVITTSSIVEVYPPIARSLIEHHYDTLSADNEGFEAEIYFRKGLESAGAYIMREGPCEGLVTVKLTFGNQRFPR
jgi:hypothetical protein